MLLSAGVIGIGNRRLPRTGLLTALLSRSIPLRGRRLAISLPTDEARRPDGVESYIRGGGGVQVDGRRVGAWLLASCALLLAALTVVFTIIAAHHNSRATSLKKRGVAVEVTVTGCVALASGTGITQAGFVCTGSYVLDGRHYVERIGGSAVQLLPGQKVAAVAVSNEPTVIYTAVSARTMHSTWTVYLTPAGLLVLLIAVLMVLRRVRPR